MRVEEIEEKIIYGIATRTNNSNEMNQMQMMTLMYQQDMKYKMIN